MARKAETCSLQLFKPEEERLVVPCYPARCLIRYFCSNKLNLLEWYTLGLNLADEIATRHQPGVVHNDIT